MQYGKLIPSNTRENAAIDTNTMIPFCNKLRKQTLFKNSFALIQGDAAVFQPLDVRTAHLNNRAQESFSVSY